LGLPCLVLALGLGAAGALSATGGAADQAVFGVPGESVAAGTTIDVREVARKPEAARAATPFRRRSPGPALPRVSPDPNMIQVGSVGGVLYAVGATF
jgi:hypothetical protein